MSCTDKTQPLLVQLWTERATRFEVHDHRIGICNLPQTLKQFQRQDAEGLRDRCFLKFVDPRFGHCSCQRCRKSSDYRTSVRIMRHRDNSLIRKVLRLLRSGDADAADVTRRASGGSHEVSASGEARRRPQVAGRGPRFAPVVVTVSAVTGEGDQRRPCDLVFRHSKTSRSAPPRLAGLD